MEHGQRLDKNHASIESYVIGYVLSLAITLAAYFYVYEHNLIHAGAGPGPFLVPILIALAMGQFVVQLIFFFHLGSETKPRWRLFVFWGMITVVCILVFGSLWIMKNLNYRMTQRQMDNYMQSQDGF